LVRILTTLPGIALGIGVTRIVMNGNVTRIMPAAGASLSTVPSAAARPTA
jgi:hypothetical protein